MKIQIHEALEQAEDEQFLCDCGKPVEEPDGSPEKDKTKYCRHCRIYWEDVKNGLFDKDAEIDRIGF